MISTNACSLLILALLVAIYTTVPSNAADVTKCWKGWVTEETSSSTFFKSKNVTKMDCANGTKHCALWKILMGKLTPPKYAYSTSDIYI